MFALLCIWFLISFPLVWVGVWLGYRRVLKDPPVKTNMVPRVIPSQAWYLNQLFTMLIGGVLPFGAVFIELYFIMSSVWLQRFYYVFGFLALVLLILLITCGEMAIVLATSSATRTTTGGGAPSSRRARRGSTSSPTR